MENQSIDYASSNSSSSWRTWTTPSRAFQRRGGCRTGMWAQGTWSLVPAVTGKLGTSSSLRFLTCTTGLIVDPHLRGWQKGDMRKCTGSSQPSARHRAVLLICLLLRCLNGMGILTVLQGRKGLGVGRRILVETIQDLEANPSQSLSPFPSIAQLLSASGTGLEPVRIVAGTGSGVVRRTPDWQFEN